MIWTSDDATNSTYMLWTIAYYLLGENGLWGMEFLWYAMCAVTAVLTLIHVHKIVSCDRK